MKLNRPPQKDWYATVHHEGQPKQWHCMMCGNVVTAQIKPKRCPECEIGKMEAWTTLPTDTASSLSD